MSCPAWEDCHKKNCIEQYICMNADYWARYWKIQKENKSPLWTERKSDKKKRKLANKVEFFKGKPYCSGPAHCDKKRSCEIMAQCIFAIERFADKPALLNALRGPHTPEQVINILREYDPEPMRSYYFCQKKKL